MDTMFQADIDKCMAEVEEFLEKKRLRYREFMALSEPGGPRTIWVNPQAIS